MAFSAQLTPNVVSVRGTTMECWHHVSAAVYDESGHCHWSLGLQGLDDPLIYLRSAAKPFQALVSWEHFKESTQQALPREAFAVMLASHTGMPIHRQWVERLILQAGLTVSDLRCPCTWPVDATARQEAKALTVTPDASMHNCSGKHAGMLLACVEQGWSVSDYYLSTHPLQQAITRRFEDIQAQTSSQRIDISIDGCGVPVHALSLSAVATAYAGLATTPVGHRVSEIMRSYPILLSGPSRIDTEIIRVTNGKIIPKVGADGVLAAHWPDEAKGIVLKLWDGQHTLRNQLFIKVLHHVEWLNDSEYCLLCEKFPEWSMLRYNDHGAQIGHYEITFDETV